MLCLPSSTAPMLCRRVADKNFAIWPVRHVFACIGGVAYERLRYKRRNLSEVAECDAEECRQFRNWHPNVSRLCGKVAVILQHMLKGCRIVGDRMLKCGGIVSI